MFVVIMEVMGARRTQGVRKAIILSNVFNFEIFPSDVYFLEQLPSEINTYSIIVIFIFSLIISALASYLPAMAISKMKTFRALKYD